jgi:hypothetical protein
MSSAPTFDSRIGWRLPRVYVLQRHHAEAAFLEEDRQLGGPLSRTLCIDWCALLPFLQRVAVGLAPVHHPQVSKVAHCREVLWFERGWGARGCGGRAWLQQRDEGAPTRSVSEREKQVASSVCRAVGRSGKRRSERACAGIPLRAVDSD